MRSERLRSRRLTAGCSTVCSLMPPESRNAAGAAIRNDPDPTLRLRPGELAGELFEHSDVAVYRIVRVLDGERPLLLAARRREDAAVHVPEPGELRQVGVLVRLEGLVVDHAHR